MQANCEPTVEEPCIVVYRCTESTQFHRLATLKDCCTVIIDTVEQALVVVKYNLERVVSTGKYCLCDSLVVFHLYLGAVVCDICNERALDSFLQRQLLIHLHITFLCPRHILLQKELNLHKVLLVCCKL